MTSMEEYIDTDNYSYNFSLNKRQRKFQWFLMIFTIIVYLLLLSYFIYMIYISQQTREPIDNFYLLLILFVFITFLFYYWYYNASVYVAIFMDTYLYGLPNYV